MEKFMLGILSDKSCAASLVEFSLFDMAGKSLNCIQVRLLRCFETHIVNI